MELDHDFTVPVPVDQAWAVLLDVERVAHCMPGATLDSVEGEEYAGRMKVKVGAMAITYRGTARIVAADEASRTVTLEAAAKEARGPGTASATVQARLEEAGGTTRVRVHTKLNVTGRPAQFGRNILSEVGSKIIARFAKALAEELEAGTGTPQADTPVASPPVADTPVAETPVSQTPVAETPVTDAAEADTPVTGTPIAGTADTVAAGSGADQPEPPTAAKNTTTDVPSAGTPNTTAPSTPATGPAAASSGAAGAGATDAGAAGEGSGGAGARAVRAVRPVREEDDAIDLLEVAGPSLVKRAVPAAGALVAVVLAVRFAVRRRKGRKGR
ncbi:SRPBCC family protein [Actinomadura fibrosa]|uniref:SRPBCC domain-containing protein n=1 Tax=Actinomadura fibrosa TaxID=111802 RepID=A0ABW2XGE6_9ACTN|nr:SRPBCC family protein [Actinomadura fibrosa]